MVAGSIPACVNIFPSTILRSHDRDELHPHVFLTFFCSLEYRTDFFFQLCDMLKSGHRQPDVFIKIKAKNFPK